MFIRCSDTLGDTLSALYDSYVLADDSTLTDDAIELKNCYKYVINDLVLHDELYFVDKDTDDYTKYSLSKQLENYFDKNNIKVIGDTGSVYPVSKNYCDEIVKILYN